MPLLNDMQRARLRQVAQERGVDEDALIETAENLQRQRDQGEQPSDAAPEGEAAAPQHPEAGRFLVGFLPYVRVREFRKIWLGIEESIPDDDLPTGKWLEKHGGPHAGGGGSSQGEGEGNE